MFITARFHEVSKRQHLLPLLLQRIRGWATTPNPQHLSSALEEEDLARFLACFNGSCGPLVLSTSLVHLIDVVAVLGELGIAYPPLSGSMQLSSGRIRIREEALQTPILVALQRMRLALPVDDLYWTYALVIPQTAWEPDSVPEDGSIAPALVLALDELTLGLRFSASLYLKRTLDPVTKELIVVDRLADIRGRQNLEDRLTSVRLRSGP